MRWRPITTLHYVTGVLAGLALGATLAGAAICAAILTA